MKIGSASILQLALAVVNIGSDAMAARGHAGPKLRRPGSVAIALGLTLLATNALAQYTITTVAGGANQTTPMPAVQADLGPASGLAVDGAGNVYFSSAGQNCVFKIDKNGLLTRVAGTEKAPGPRGDTRVGNTAATRTELDSPQGLAIDAAGNLYIAETGANRVRKVSSGGAISIVAGGIGAGYSGDAGPAISAQLNQPTGIALDASGRLFIADTGNYRVRMVSVAGTIATVAGNGTTTYGSDGSSASSSGINFTDSVATDAQGNLYFADRLYSTVRRVSPGGAITTIAGNGSFGYSGDFGLATSAQLNQPSGVAVDGAGNVYIADSGNNVIRAVSSSGRISTVAGNGKAGYSGDGGAALNATLAAWSISTDSAGNLYVFGGDSHIRRVASGGTIATIEGSGLSAASVLATQATLQFPQGLAADSSGNLYIADAGNNVIRKLTHSGGPTAAASNGIHDDLAVRYDLSDGVLTTTAGNGTPGYSGDGSAATNAQLKNPDGLAVDSNGNLYIADSGNNVVRRVTPGATISTFAGGGNGGCNYSGPATNAQLVSPAGLAADSSGNLYIADSGNGCIREVSIATGMIITVAGGSNTGDPHVNDQTNALLVDLYFPQGVAVDQAGNLYIADTGNSCVRKVTPSGTASIIAGNGLIGISGDGDPASSAALGAPYAVAVDGSGSVYIADTLNQRIRKVSDDGAIATIAGTGTPGYAGDDRGAACAELNNPWSLAVDRSGVIYFSDWGNGAVRALRGGAVIVGSDCAVQPPQPFRRPILDRPSDSPAVIVSSAPVAESASALSGGSYTPGPDPDFSYLSLLQPNLPFVQLIRSYLSLASSLASMAETTRGAAGSSLLADRSQILQYVKIYAWMWMMTNAAEGNLPLYMDYTTATGHSIPIYDTFSPTDAADAFTPADKSILTNFLNIMPAALLQYEQLIVNGPINGMTGGAGTTGGYESSIQSIDGIADGALAHEISLTLLAGLVNNISVVAQEWNALWNASTAPPWDCADVYENYPVRPMPSNFNPYGDVAKEEDFATIFSDWLGSGTPRLKPNQSSSILEQAIYAAWQSGKPGGPPADDTILLQKTLIIASLFTDPSSMMLSLYYHLDYTFPNTIELLTSPVQVSPTTLSFGGYTFALQNGTITGVTSPASQATYNGQVVSIPALSYTFPTPAPIPAFAASRWGMN